MGIFASGNQNKVACVLVLDGSLSMTTKIAGDFTRLDALNEGTKIFAKELKQDEVASESVDVAVIKVTDPQPELVKDWTLAENFTPPEITAQGSTPLASALLKAVDMCEQRKEYYFNKGMDYYRPWIIIISDGEPTDSSATWQNAVDTVQTAIKKKKAFTVGVAIDKCPTAKLQQVSCNKVMELSSHHFKEFFIWLSASLSETSQSSDGTEQFANMDLLGR